MRTNTRATVLGAVVLLALVPAGCRQNVERLVERAQEAEAKGDHGAAIAD